MLNKELFVNLITGLCEMYDKKPSEFIYDMYYDLLKDYDYPVVEKAVKKVMATYKYSTLPKPADILEFIIGTPADKSLVAWIQARGAIASVGYYYSVEFSDPIISCIINELGGWMEFCSSLTEDMPFIEKRFRELYNVFEKREVKTPIALVGFYELDNRTRQLPENIPAPVKIGFTDKPKEIE